MDLSSTAEELVGGMERSASANDADTGGDGSDSRETPTRLSGTGSYTGEIAHEDDVDWFGLTPETTDLCVEATASGSAQTAVVLELPGLPTVESGFHKAKDEAVSLALAGADVADIKLGFTERNEQARAAGSYSFDLASFGPSELLADADGGSGGDAGDTPANAVPVTPGCIGGSLGSTDTADVFSFEGADGELITLSLAQLSGDSTLVVDLVDPTGQTVATVGESEVLQITLDADGTWYLSAHRDTGTSTLAGLAGPFEVDGSASANGFAIALDDPDPEPCDPGCV